MVISWGFSGFPGNERGREEMKLIKWIAIWMAVFVAVMYWMAITVAPGFAEYFKQPLFVVCGVMGLLFGLSGQIRKAKEKKAIRVAMQAMSESKDRRTQNAVLVKASVDKICTDCRENLEKLELTPVEEPDFLADEILEDLMTNLARATELHSGLAAAIQTMEEEDGAV